MNALGSTEETYQRWIQTQGPLVTAYQEHRAQEIFRLARALDMIPGETDRARQTVVERRTRLLRKLRSATQDLRAAMADEDIGATVGRRT